MRDLLLSVGTAFCLPACCLPLLMKTQKQFGQKNRAAWILLSVGVLLLLYRNAEGPQEYLIMTVFYLLLYRASLSDISTMEMPDHIWQAVLLLAIPGLTVGNIIPRICGGLFLLLLTVLVSLFGKNRIGGADIKLSASAVFFLGISRGMFGFTAGLLTAVIAESIRKHKMKKTREAGDAEKPFPLLPYLSAGFLIAAGI